MKSLLSNTKVTLALGSVAVLCVSALMYAGVLDKSVGQSLISGLLAGGALTWHRGTDQSESQ